MNLMSKITDRMNSDKGATNTVEMIIMIALAVFAALALFTYILTPVQESADELGDNMEKGLKSVINSGGDASQLDGIFSGGGSGGGEGGGSGGGEGGGSGGGE